MIFLFFGGKGERGNGMGGDECKLWIWGSASYQQVASKLEMVDSIGGE